MLDSVWKYPRHIVWPLPVTFLSPAHKGSQTQTWRQEPVCCFYWGYFFLWLKEENKVQVVLTRSEEQRQMDWLVNWQTGRTQAGGSAVCRQGDRRVSGDEGICECRGHVTMKLTGQFSKDCIAGWEMRWLAAGEKGGCSRVMRMWRKETERGAC